MITGDLLGRPWYPNQWGGGRVEGEGEGEEEQKKSLVVLSKFKVPR